MADNSKDMVERKRHQFGSRKHNAKLTESQALEIYNADGTLAEIGKRYGVDFSIVGKIKRKAIWKHIHERVA